MNKKEFVVIVEFETKFYDKSFKCAFSLKADNEDEAVNKILKAMHSDITVLRADAFELNLLNDVLEILKYGELCFID